MNWKTWVPLLLAIVLGLLAAKASRNLILRAGRGGAASGRLTAAVVAKADLPPGAPLGESDLATVLMPADAIPGNAFQSISSVVGRVLVQPVVKGQTILESLLAPEGSGPGPQALVPNGLRAMSIDVNESSGVAGLLTPGCFVDVVSTLQDEKANQAVARTIVQSAKVLAVGQNLQVSPRKEAGDGGGRARSVTLLVGPRDAQAIELAGSTGKLRLVLRSSTDTARCSTDGLTIAELLERPQPVWPITIVQDPPPEPKATASVAVRSVEVIRSGKSEQVQLGVPAPPGGGALTGDTSQSTPVIPGRSP